VIVVDANILLYSYFPSDHKVIVDRLFMDDPAWMAPPLWRSEFRNVAGRFVKRGLPYEKAFEIVTLAEQFMEGNEVPVFSEEVMPLMNQSGCTAYGCEYVAAALKRSVPLITFDQEVLKKFPGIAFSAEEFLGNR
jgi:predicted nucleic acid-binding protein